MTEQSYSSASAGAARLTARDVKAIDRLAGAETISRAAWIRRLLVQSAQRAAEQAA